MNVFSHPEFDNHEQVNFFNDEKQDCRLLLRCITAIVDQP